MRLLERVAAVGARRRLTPTTLAGYRAWLVQFLRFCRDGARWRPPAKLGAADVEAFLTQLARDRRLSASSQNQAANAIVFLYKHRARRRAGPGPPGAVRRGAERSRRPVRVPAVLSAAEVQRVIAAVEPGSAPRLMVELLYGTGMRISECRTLRVRDVDFERRQIVIRGGKGNKDRVVMLPARCRPPGGAGAAGAAPARPGPGGRRGVRAGARRRRQQVPVCAARRAVAVPLLQRDDAAGRAGPGVPVVGGPRVPWTGGSDGRRGTRGLPSGSAPTPSDTASPRTCWRRGTTSGRCRRCWATRRSRPRWFTRT